MNDVYFRVVAEPLVTSGRNSSKIKDRLSNDRIPQLRASVSQSRVSKVYLYCCSGPGCSKLTTSLVNETLKFQTFISQICLYFLLKKKGVAFAVQKLLSFFQQKISVYLVIKW